jgi:hypothetical protein
MIQVVLEVGDVVIVKKKGDADAVKEALESLVSFEHKGDARIFNSKNPFYEKWDELAPFFSESYLYTLFEDKDAARSLRGRLRLLVQALGYEREIDF